MSLMKELSEVFELCKRGIRTDGSITPELKVKLPVIFALLTVRLYGITCNDHEQNEELVVLLPSLLPHTQYCRNFKRFCLSMHQLLLKDGSVQPCCYLQLVQQCNNYANPLIIQLLATLEHMDGKIHTLADSQRLAICFRQWMAMVAPTGVVPSDKLIHESIHTALDLAYNAEPMHSASLQSIHRSVAHILACLLDMGSCNVGVAARDFVEKLLCTSIHQIASGGTDGFLESSPLVRCVGLALAVSATGTANPLTESFRPHIRNPRGESPSAHIRYRRVHGLLRDAFRGAVRTYVVQGTPPVSLSGSGVHPAGADAAPTALVPRQRKAILRSLIDWMFIVGRSMPGADTITIDILCEELLFPADAGFVAGFGSQAAVLAVPFRLVAIDSTAQALRRGSGCPGPQCCDRLVGMLCDVAMLDRSAAVRGRALEVLLQVHFPAIQGIAPPAGTMNDSANSRGFSMNSGVLKVLLLKCGDISLPVARVAIAGLLHQLTAEGVLTVFRVAHCSSSTDPVPVAAIIGLLESIRFLVQLYCHRFSTLVVSTAAAAAAEGAGLAPGAIHGLMSDCRTEQESLYELCQSLSECHLLTACCYPCLSVCPSVCLCRPHMRRLALQWPPTLRPR
jgi:hypothetical protein